MKIIKFLGWLLLSIASAAGLASSASRSSENEIFSFLFACAAGIIAFASTWGTRRNLRRWAREMSKDAGMWFFCSILGVGLFISQLAYDPKWQNIFSGAAFALACIGPLAIGQAKIIREFQYDPLSDHEE